jgi:hypothetical protein
MWILIDRKIRESVDEVEIVKTKGSKGSTNCMPGYEYCNILITYVSGVTELWCSSNWGLSWVGKDGNNPSPVIKDILQAACNKQGRIENFERLSK